MGQRQRTADKYNAAGERWCIGCRRYLPVTAFAGGSTLSDGLQSRCRACAKARSDAWRAANPEQARAVRRAEYHRRMAARRAWESG